MITIKKTIDYFLAVADLLRTVKRKKFNMQWWAKRHVQPGKTKYPEVKTPEICNTEACFGGWLTVVIPELKLRFAPGHLYGTVFNERTEAYGSAAVADALNIPLRDAENLCQSYGYVVTPKQKAVQIDKFAKKLADAHGYDIVEV